MVVQAEFLFSEVLNALCQIAEKRSVSGPLNNGMKIPETRRQIAELEAMLQKEKAEFEVRFFFINFMFSYLIKLVSLSYKPYSKHICR